MKDQTDSKQVFSGMFWKFGERVCAQIVTFIVSIILARILDPVHYGTISIVLVFINIANVFVENGFSAALIQKKDANHTDFSTIFYFNIIFSIGIFVVIYVSAPHIEKFYQMKDLSLALRILAVKIPISAINSVQHAYVSRHMIFRKFFFATIAGTIISAVVGIYMAYKGYGVFSLVAQYLVNSFIGTLVLWFIVRWRPTMEFSLSRLKILFKYGWKILASYLLLTVYEDVYSIVIGKIYTSEDLAYYSKGKHYPQLIISNVNTTISAVLFPMLSKYQDDNERICMMMRRSIKTSSYIISPLMIGMAAIAEPLVSFVLTDKWLPCVPFIRLSCFYLLLMPMQYANLQAIKALGRSDLTLILEIIKRIIGILILIVTMNYGVLAIACGAVVTTIISSIINAYPNRKLLGYHYAQQILDMLPSILMAGVMGSIIYFIAFIKIPKIYILIFQMFLGIALYIGMSFLSKNENLTYILQVIRNFKREISQRTINDGK